MTNHYIDIKNADVILIMAVMRGDASISSSGCCVQEHERQNHPCRSALPNVGAADHYIACDQAPISLLAYDQVHLDNKKYFENT